MARAEVVHALLARGAQAAATATAAVCVALRFSPAEQGLFFVFLSLGALIQLAEFGLASAVLQTASHLAANGRMAALAGLRQQGRRIHALLLAPAALLICGAGALLFTDRTDLPWAGPWLACVGAALAAQCVAFEVTYIDGADSALAAWRIRLVQELCGGSVFVGALLGGAGLWSLAAYWGTRAALGLLLVLRHVAPASGAAAPLDWRRDVWPFQWRVGLSGLSGFLIFQAFNPILLAEQGSAVAGRFGMSLAVMNMLLLLTGAWPLSQASRYGTLIAQQRHAQARRAMHGTRTASTALAVLLALLSFGTIELLRHAGVALVDRLADAATNAALLATGVVHHATLCIAVLLRAERREPLLAVSVLGGAVTALAIWAVARVGSAADVAVTSLVFSAAGFAVVLFHERRFAARTA